MKGCLQRTGKGSSEDSAMSAASGVTMKHSDLQQSFGARAKLTSLFPAGTAFEPLERQELATDWFLSISTASQRST